MRRTHVLGFALAACVMAAAALPACGAAADKSETAEKPAKAEKSTRPAKSAEEQKQLEFARLADDLKKLFGDKKYEEGVVVCRKMIDLVPSHPLTHYNLACGLARLGKTDDALAALAKAVDVGYADPAHLQEDEDLASLRTDKQFAAIVEAAKVNQKAGGGRYEKGEEIPGTKTVEGFPDSGLRWRLRMSPDATAEKPNRLVMWLHPAGGSFNKQVEAMAPAFIKRGYALLVFTHRTFMSWTADDIDRIGRTLADAAKTEGLDVARPILLGSRAGGQVALEMWSKTPGAYGGVVLCSAYPVRRVGGVQLSVVPIPVEEAVKKTPMIVFMGDKDNGAALWKQRETAFHISGVPLSIRYAPMKDIGAFLEAPQVTELDKWLAEVAAGKLPADPLSAVEKKDMPAFKLPPDLRTPEKPAPEKAPDKTPAEKAPAAKTPAEKPKG